MRSARFKAAAVETDERAGARAEALPLLSVSQTRGVIRRSEISDDPPRADDLSTYKLVTRNDIVLNRMSAYKGAVGVAAEDGICSPDYAVLRARDGWSPRYLGRLMASHWFVGEMSARLRGIGSVDGANVRTPRITVTDLGNIAVPVLSVDRQECIADFLDRETAEIDAFLADLNRLVQLLVERRASVVRAWLPSIPSGGNARLWRQVRVGDVAQLINGFPFESASFGDEGMPLIRIRDLNSATASTRFGGTPISSVTIDSRDLLVGMDGDFNVGRWLGNEPALLNQRMLALRSDLSTSRLLEYTLPASLERINDLTYATTVKHLSSGQVRAIRLCVPRDAVLARELLDRLDREVSAIDSAVSDAEKAIVLSRERRAALISAAVTCEIDVTA